MKLIIFAAAAFALTLTACQTNPGNIGAGMVAERQAQLQRMNQSYATNPNITCEMIDSDIRASYLALQPEEAGFLKRTLSTGQGVAETIGLQQVNNAIPGAGLANTIFKGKKGREKAAAMFGGQMSGINKIQILQSQRAAKGCEGNVYELFEEK